VQLITWSPAPPEIAPAILSPIQGHSTSFGRFDQYFKLELPTFGSGHVVSCSVESEHSTVTAANLLELATMIVHSAQALDVKLTGAAGHSTESEPCHETDCEQPVE
jgi:hypothetical protein